MTELLETTLAPPKKEWTLAAGTNEALERFLRFRPPKFYGEAEQEIKAELFFEHLTDIYDTLGYDDVRKVTFAAFPFKRTTRDWWLSLGESRAQRGESWTWNDFQEEFKKEYILC